MPYSNNFIYSKSNKVFLKTALLKKFFSSKHLSNFESDDSPYLGDFEI